MDAITFKVPRLKKLVLYTFFLAVSACGGGGSGDGGNGPFSIDYTGNTNPAVISNANAAKLVANVFVGDTIVGSSSGAAARIDLPTGSSATGTGVAQFSSRLSQKLRSAVMPFPGFAMKPGSAQARTNIDERESCANSDGLVHINGFLEDNGTGTLTLDYTNCREGEEILDGKVTAQINAFDFSYFLPTDAIFRFAGLTLKSSTLNLSVDGAIHSQISTGTQTEQLTIDKIVTRNNATGEMLMINNQVSTIEYDSVFFPLSYSETISGRIYDSTHGYVDITTIDPLVFSTINQPLADSGGLLLTGGNNTRIRASVFAATVIMLELDLIGDGFDVGSFTIIRESELSDPAGTDLDDDDNDGMHNSWEMTNGFDPNDVSDASADADGDGTSNIREYYTGSDPNNAGFISEFDRPVTEITFFSSAAGYSAGNSQHAIAVSDFDGDGNADLALADWDGNGVSVLLGDGSGAFGSDASFAAGHTPGAIALGDFNGDGNTDITVANWGGLGVSVLLGTGLGTFSEPVSIELSVEQNAMAVAVGDFNRDGNQDIAVTMGYGGNSTPGRVAVLLGDGSGGFGAPTNFTVGGEPYSLATGDFDGDSILDIAVANRSNGSVSILLGDGAGDFVAATELAVGGRPQSIIAGDFNGDGRPDLVVAMEMHVINWANVTILQGLGSGVFGPGTAYILDGVNGASPNGITADDFNGDGRLDLAVSAASSADGVFILFGDGAGSFGMTNYFITLGHQPSAVTAADLNGDSKPDLIASAWIGSSKLAAVSLNNLP